MSYVYLEPSEVKRLAELVEREQPESLILRGGDPLDITLNPYRHQGPTREFFMYDDGRTLTREELDDAA